MNIREFISVDKAYSEAEAEIKAWVESSYPGLSIEFEPHIEIVKIDQAANYTKRRVRKIVEAVNIKIGEIMEQHAERIYIAERLERIYKNHPHWSIDVESIEDIKKNKQFLEYFNELILR